MNDEKKQMILLAVGFVIFFVWVCDVIMHPVTYTELPLEKRIQYEQMIFPNVR